MTKEHFRRTIRQLYERLLELTVSKGEEYTDRDEHNQFQNFEDLAEQLDLSREKVLWVFLQKHLNAIRTYVKDDGQRVQSEPIAGRIDDAILYLLLLRGMTMDVESDIQAWEDELAKQQQDSYAVTVTEADLQNTTPTDGTDLSYLNNE